MKTRKSQSYRTGYYGEAATGHQGGKMSPYQESYKKKMCTPEEAVRQIKSGDWVDYGNFACAPLTLDAALAARVNEVEDVKVRAMTYPGMAAVAKADPTGTRFVYNNWHFSGGDRKLHDAGNCFYVPFLFHEGPGFYNIIDSDVFCVAVAPMDARGYFNFGSSNSIQMAVAKRAKKVIVEINRNIPHCYGGFNEGIHIDEVDLIVESDHKPLFQLPSAAPSEIDGRIAKLIMEEIHDGSCIQLGIGGMPNAVGKMIAESDLKDLGVHTEMLADSFVDMFEAGRITCKYTKYCPGKMAYTFALGSQKLYDFLDKNPFCASYSVDLVNKPANVSMNDKMVAINTAVELDLFGQVSSESSGPRHISGTGGQFDYTFGADHAPGGKSFICLSSTTKGKNGELISRIRPTFTPGSIITVPRTVTHWVVTEYGKVNLKGKSTWERAEALISIAHPDFRDELVQEAQKMGIWRAGDRKHKIQNPVNLLKTA